MKRVDSDIASEIDEISTDPLTCYLNEVGQFSLLTPDEEIRLGNLSQRGDLDARNKLVVGNLRLVVWIAKKYQYSGLPLLDLIQEGNIGLIEAAETFDPKRGLPFASLAQPCIRNRIVRGLINARLVRMPIIQKGTMRDKIRIAVELLRSELEREPTPEEVVDRTDIPHLKVLTIMEEMQIRTISLNVPLDSDRSGHGSDLIESVPDLCGPAPDHVIIIDSALRICTEELRSLVHVIRSMRYRKRSWQLDAGRAIFLIRYGLTKEHRLCQQSFDDIGVQFGISRSRVGQICKYIFQRLRDSEFPVDEAWIQERINRARSLIAIANIDEVDYMDELLK